MNIFKIIALLTVITFFPAGAEARDYSRMYPASELKRANSVYSPNIREVLFENIASYLSASELSTLNRVDLRQPWNRTKDPFEFTASASGVMLIPTFSVKFFDDLAIVTAWFDRFNCDKKPVFDYVAALDFSNLDLPAPHIALNVPHQAYKLDPWVDDVSQKTLKSALAFIFLHELGHIHHRHQSYDVITAEQAQAQEAEADQFAIRVMRRMRLAPLGMTLWFMAVSMRDPLVPGSPRQTHPLTASRLHAIADMLRKHPSDFIEPADLGKISTDVIISVANDIDGIGTRLENPNLRSVMRQRGRNTTLKLLKDACK